MKSGNSGRDGAPFVEVVFVSESFAEMDASVLEREAHNIDGKAG